MTYYMLQHKTTKVFMGTKPRIYDESSVGCAFANGHHNKGDWGRVEVFFDDRPESGTFGCVLHNKVTQEYLCGHPRNGKGFLDKVKPPRRYATQAAAALGMVRSGTILAMDPNEFEILYIKSSYSIPGVG